MVVYQHFQLIPVADEVCGEWLIEGEEVLLRIVQHAHSEGLQEAWGKVACPAREIEGQVRGKMLKM
jgi:hypothetical protein